MFILEFLLLKRICFIDVMLSSEESNRKHFIKLIILYFQRCIWRSTGKRSDLFQVIQWCGAEMWSASKSNIAKLNALYFNSPNSVVYNKTVITENYKIFWRNFNMQLLFWKISLIPAIIGYYFKLIIRNKNRFWLCQVDI